MADTVIPFRSTADHPTRRALLAGAALAVPAAALPALAAAPVEPDPHPAWYREWEALLDWCNTPGLRGGRDLVEFPQWHRLDELEGLIGATPARTVAGAVAQLRVVNHWLGGNAYVGEAVDAGLENALATLERLAGEARA